MSGFNKDDTNAFFLDCINSMVELKNNGKITEGEALFALEKFHYFTYAIMLEEHNGDTQFNKLFSLFDLEKITQGLVEIVFDGNKYYASTETLVNLVVRHDPDDFDELSLKLNSNKYNVRYTVDELSSFFLEKYLDGEIRKDIVVEIYNLLSGSSNYNKIKEAMKSYETDKVFHGAPPSRPQGNAYTSIGENWQKQSISSNAGWVPRIRMLFDFGRNWLDESSISPKDVSNQKKFERGTIELPKVSDPSLLILLGPPGTGKTRASRIIANLLLAGKSVPLNIRDFQLGNETISKDLIKGENVFSSQFHPSFSYEDFLEGLRPVQLLDNGKSDVSYEVVPGVFKIVSQLARTYFDKTYGIEFIAKFEKGSIVKWLNDEASPISPYGIRAREGVFVFEMQVIARTGREVKQIAIEDSLNGFYRIKWYAETKEVENFVLFIDELNRGNPAKIFGEALSLIENSKRMGRKEEGELNLPYSKEKLLVPPNLHLICAMNSSDKSLAHLDQAFRRRFKFLYFEPNFETVISGNLLAQFSEFGVEKKTLEMVKAHFEIINKSLDACDIGVDNHIGHSYALDLLRVVYFELRNVDKPNIEKILLVRLEQCWNKYLHSLLRDILSEYRINDFSDKFTELSKKNAESLGVLATLDSFEKNFKKYLSSASSEGNDFPWKKAS